MYRDSMGQFHHDSRESEDNFGTSPTELKPERTLAEHEVCFLCDKEIRSIETVYLGQHFICRDDAMLVQPVLDAIAKHVMEGMANSHKINKASLKDVCIRAATRHLDVRALQLLERTL